MTSPAKSFAAALGLFTICPIPDRYAGPPPAHVVRWLPAIGVVVGGTALLPALAVWRGANQGSPFLGAVLIVVGFGAVTRGLHLDGLADLADGLGSRRQGAEALAVMRRSDIGPFGVVAIVTALLIQVASLATILAVSTRSEACLSVVLTTVTGRVAVIQAASSSVPSARAHGFGALIAGSVTRLERITVTCLLLAAALAAQWDLGDSLRQASFAVGAAATALITAALVRGHVLRRLGGITGDVFGALVEVASTTTVLMLAVCSVWK